MFDAAMSALAGFADPGTLLMLCIGVVAGLAMGVLPGLGGTAAVGILLPFVITLPPQQSLAVLIGAVAVVHHSDVITAVLLRVPGSASAAVIMADGNALARRGQAARALSLCFVASMIGGLLGAVGLTFSIPIAQPLVLAFGSPELFMLTVLGIGLAALLSQGNMLKGLVAGSMGLLIGMIGAAPAAATYRFSFGADSLLDGVGLVPLALGLFGLAEIAHLVARRSAVAERVEVGDGWRQGALEALREWKTALRGVFVGMWAGVLPGLGATAGTYMAYGQAVATTRGDERKTFGHGNTRGLVAAESAANSVEAGDLIPTLLFGIPGAAPAALLLGALLAYGIQPGPQMITDHLDVMYTVVWSFVIASVVGSLVCFFLVKPLARLSYVPFQYLAPALLLVMFAAAYSESTQFGGLVVMLVLGVVGYALKVADFPRSPLLIGFILSVPLERYYFLTSNLYSTGEWIKRPLVIAMMVVLLIPLLLVPVRRLRARRTQRAAATSSVLEDEVLEPLAVGAAGDPANVRRTADVRSASSTAAAGAGDEEDGPSEVDREEGALASTVWPFIIAVVALAAFVTAYIVAQGYPSRARLVPTLVTVLGTALTCVLAVREGLAILRRRRRGAAWNHELTHTALAFGWLVLLVALVNFLGFVVGALVFLPLFLLVVSRLSVIKTVLYTVAAVALLVVAYLYGNIDLPGGMMLPLLPGFQA